MKSRGRLKTQMCCLENRLASMYAACHTTVLVAGTFGLIHTQPEVLQSKDVRSSRQCDWLSWSFLLSIKLSRVAGPACCDKGDPEMASKQQWVVDDPVYQPLRRATTNDQLYGDGLLALLIDILSASKHSSGGVSSANHTSSPFDVNPARFPSRLLRTQWSSQVVEGAHRLSISLRRDKVSLGRAASKSGTCTASTKLS